jgi:hypothetical protein
MPAKKVRRPALKLETGYRSRLEQRVADQLQSEGITFGYETLKVKFDIPARGAKYTPDFECGPIVLETKGYFRKTSDRQRLVLIKEQHPDLDLRLVFQDASKPIYKGSPTTYADWANDHGFQWADGGWVPAAWIKEMKHVGTRSRTKALPRRRPAGHSASASRSRLH